MKNILALICLMTFSIVLADTGNQGDKPIGPDGGPTVQTNPPCEWYQWCYWFD
jgi:hypothetical protein